MIKTLKNIISWSIFDIIIGGPIAYTVTDSMLNYYHLGLPIAIGIGIVFASFVVLFIAAAEIGSNINMLE